MIKYNIEITLLSPCIIGSGEGYGSLIDTDVIFDEFGIPFIPAKRIKGCLRDSATQVLEMFSLSKINLLNTERESSGDFLLIEKVFGKRGSDRASPIIFNSCYLNQYEDIVNWIKYLSDKHKNYISRESLIDRFSEIRQQTTIEENGVAKKHSLRTMRALKKGLKFYGEIINISSDVDYKNIEMLLFYASKALKNIGTKRNRGFGKVECKLYKDSKEINYISNLEEVCSD